MGRHVTDEELRQAVDAYEAHDHNKEHAANELSISRSTLRDRLKLAARRGLMLGHPPAMPGYQIKKLSTQEDKDGQVVKSYIQQTLEPGEEFKVPEGHIIKGESALVDETGRVIQKWVKTKEGELDPLWIVDRLKDAFKDYEPAAKPALVPHMTNDDLLTLIPCNDWHLGMFSWKQETDENWDLKAAQKAISEGLEDTIFQSRQSDTAVVLVGGDLLHADNQTNETNRSGNQLDVDGRYPKILEAASMLIVHAVDCALTHHKNIIVRVLPGNHDEHSSFAVAMFLQAWYRNEPRVTVDKDRSLFWWYRFGQVMLGSTHGHTVKIKDMAGIMAARRAEDWGATKYRYIHGFHLHHKERIANEGGGAISEIHQAPIPQDSWHFNKGYLSGRSLQAITYHRDRGEVSRVVTAIE